MHKITVRELEKGLRRRDRERERKRARIMIKLTDEKSKT